MQTIPLNQLIGEYVDFQLRGKNFSGRIRGTVERRDDVLIVGNVFRFAADLILFEQGGRWVADSRLQWFSDGVTPRSWNEPRPLTEDDREGIARDLSQILGEPVEAFDLRVDAMLDAARHIARDLESVEDLIRSETEAEKVTS